MLEHRALGQWRSSLPLPGTAALLATQTSSLAQRGNNTKHTPTDYKQGAIWRYLHWRGVDNVRHYKEECCRCYWELGLLELGQEGKPASNLHAVVCDKVPDMHLQTTNTNTRTTALVHSRHSGCLTRRVTWWT